MSLAKQWGGLIGRLCVEAYLVAIAIMIGVA
jgi:hypothetical protein